MIYWPAKAPGETEDFLFDFTDTLEAGETIASRIVSVVGVTKVSDAIVSVDTEADAGVLVWLSGGTFGTSATVACSVTTDGGRTYSATAILLIGEEPVSLAQAKQHLRVFDDTSEDELIADYIRSARAYVESESGYVFVRRQFTDSFNRWPAHLNIGRRPLVSVDEIAYLDSKGLPQTVASSDYYTALALRRVTPVGIWPSGSAVSVTYTAGFALGDGAEELELARQAILLLVGHWYANRETVSIEAATPLEVPFAARALIDRFRTVMV